ncbi:MAG: type II toxin-antitoxin system VapC family toxin [Betaproteobacteria bacterium]|nr:type II toxin-antitoxin system VapC family toxin [Betaproteobacteria bacterium]
MSYLLDTNVVSELVKPRPDRYVLEWFARTPDHALHISVLTLGEIRKGVEKIADRTRREKLRLWLENDLPAWFGHQVLPVGTEVADRWGRLMADAKRTLPSIDSLLAATALHHELRIVSRNVQDFAPMGVEVVNPWLPGK